MTPPMTYKTAIESTPVTTTTENGMATYTSSLNAHVDLFFQFGALRRFPERAVDLFSKAYAKDKILAVKLALFGRDVRGGNGERNTFREILKYLERTGEFEMINQIVSHIPTFGRWDDLLVFQSSETRKNYSYPIIKAALQAGDALCAKWMPRKGPIAAELRDYMEMKPKQYRKTLVNLTKVVETQMCSNEWDKIHFPHVPSVASARYQKAFTRHCGMRYQQYKDALVKGEVKINASTLFPYDCITSLKFGDSIVASAQWDALPNYLGDNRILPVVDTSGSMTWFKVTPQLDGSDIAISLGLYCAMKQTGAFQNIIFSFNRNPTVLVLTGKTLAENHHNVSYNLPVGGSTNIQACFDKILDIAKKNSVPAEEMPRFIVIFSDMQFNQCTDNPNATAFEMFKQQFAAAGYELPKVVFWNLDSRGGDVPVTFNQAGVALVSGFSPATMTAILNGKDFTPVAVMMEAIGGPRYDIFSKKASTNEGESAFHEAYERAMRLI